MRISGDGFGHLRWALILYAAELNKQKYRFSCWQKKLSLALRDKNCGDSGIVHDVRITREQERCAYSAWTTLRALLYNNPCKCRKIHIYSYGVLLSKKATQ